MGTTISMCKMKNKQQPGNKWEKIEGWANDPGVLCSLLIRITESCECSDIYTFYYM